MKKEEIKVIIILLLVSIAIIGGLLFWNHYRKQKDVIQNINDEVKEEFVQVLQDGSKLNISDNLRQIKTVEGLEISNISLKETGGITTLLADVENKTSSSIKTTKVKVELLDKQGNIMTELTGIINATKAGEKVKLNMSVLVDVANAYDIRISKK